MSQIYHITKIFNELKQNTYSSLIDKNYVTYNLFLQILNNFAPSDSLHFASIFTKIAWISTKFKFPADFTFYLHTYRRAFDHQYSILDQQEELAILGLYCCEYLIAIETKSPHPTLPQLIHFQNTRTENKGTTFKKVIEGIILSYDNKNKQFTFIEQSKEDTTIEVNYDVTGLNELFTPNIQLAQSILNLPTRVNLLDVNISDDKKYQFKAIVFIPDMLIDVSTIAAGNKTSHWLITLDKVSIRSTSSYILLGNLANFILNELLFNSQSSFEQILIEFFVNDPIQWVTYNDDITNEIVNKARNAYQNIKKIINNDFVENNIIPKFAYIEPSFLSPKYGMQGRLDLLNVNTKERINNIVELKSGKIFKPNQHGISESHFNQCLLYDLLINSTSLGSFKTLNYILYSAIEVDNLKFAPNIKTLQYDLLSLRNQYVFIEFGLAHGPDKARKMLDYLNPQNFPKLNGFTENKLVYFHQTFASLTELERSYYSHFISFIAREFLIRKIGLVEEEITSSAASLWTENYKSKIERFTVLSQLILIHNNADKKIPTLEFEYSIDSNNLSNFREGDIITLVPFHKNPTENVSHQIFKGTLLEYNEERVLVQLRHTQHNNEIFRTHDYWNIEPDFLDSAFKHYYNNLTLFSHCSDTTKRQLVLGLRKPEYSAIEEQLPLSDELTPNQKNIILRSYYAKDYMLIWGPPGTGKTSMILKYLSKLIYNNSDENILILAYTNKAVDEICFALSEVNLTETVIRIGNRNAVNPAFKHLLLNTQIKDLKKRSQISSLLKTKRITVSTVAAFLGKLDLLEIIQYDTLIIDEASQIIEPMICGILTLFKKFILIGDHMQLPAIVQQNEHYTMIKDPLLLEYGFNDLRTSLFERLFRQIKIKNDCSHAIGILSEQGRMHNDIMAFVNNHYYENKLVTITKIQNAIFDYQFKDLEIEAVAKHRLIFIDIPNQSRIHQKKNLEEAKMVERVVNSIKKLYNQNDKKINENVVGIITPFRAQINQISQFVNNSKITIDTVERFQGGARDIIIISTVVNSENQLKSICAYFDGKDRKLNVALTRAKKQIILIGNRRILETSENYLAFLNICHHIHN